MAKWILFDERLKNSLALQMISFVKNRGKCMSKARFWFELLVNNQPLDLNRELHRLRQAEMEMAMLRSCKFAIIDFQLSFFPLLSSFSLHFHILALFLSLSNFFAPPPKPLSLNFSWTFGSFNTWPTGFFEDVKTVVALSKTGCLSFFISLIWILFTLFWFPFLSSYSALFRDFLHLLSNVSSDFSLNERDSWFADLRIYGFYFYAVSFLSLSFTLDFDFSFPLLWSCLLKPV